MHEKITTAYIWESCKNTHICPSKCLNVTTIKLKISLVFLVICQLREVKGTSQTQKVVDQNDFPLLVPDFIKIQVTQQNNRMHTNYLSFLNMYTTYLKNDV